MADTLRVNPIDCTGHGVCAELLPELVTLDEWGYPIVDPHPLPPPWTATPAAPSPPAPPWPSSSRAADPAACTTARSAP